MDRLIRFGKDVMNGWLEADAFTLAAALAYYAVFSIAPLLLIAIHIASFFLDRTVVVEGLTNELAGVIGSSGSDAITQMLEAAGIGQPEGWTGIVGIAVLLFAATGFVGSLQDALDKIWDAPPRPGGLWSFIQSKFLSFSLVLAAAFLLLVSLLISTAVTALAGSFTSALGLAEGIVAAIIAVANFLLSALIFAAIFKFVPSVPVTWRAAAAAEYSPRSCLPSAAWHSPGILVAKLRPPLTGPLLRSFCSSSGSITRPKFFFLARSSLRLSRSGHDLRKSMGRPSSRDWSHANLFDAVQCASANYGIAY